MTAQTECGHLCPMTMTNASLASLKQRAGPARRLGAAHPVAQLRPQFPPARGEALRHHRHGHDGEAGRHRRARQHHARRAAAPTGSTRSPATNGSSRRRCRTPSSCWRRRRRGSTCFLMPRFLPDGTQNAIRIERLKDKLGNRSNASSEVEFHGATAWRVGEEGRGIPTILEMVTLTRLDCAVASTGLMRGGLAEAVHHVRHRSAFGKPLIDQPLMLRVLADMALDLAGGAGALAAARRGLRHGGGAAGGGGLCAADEPGGQILGLQERAGLPLRGDGVPRRQRLRRGQRAAAALSRGAGQRHLGGLRQRHGARRRARAEGRRRARPCARDDRRRARAGREGGGRRALRRAPRWPARTRARRAS